ncbi:MAG: hydantoinase B/oxoprolinase family protein [Armatimonadetes bacterium]|nr:hydantoinase B/oxoprolinase family protein [Armatimonadota bacterium]
MMTFDPISLEIMWSRLINITEECWITILRTAFSTIIGEAQDFGCELLDANANSIAHSPRSMPVFNLTLPRAVRAIFQAFPRELVVEGDVLITNDPWTCAGHLFDIAVVTPVFRRGVLVGLVGSIAHVSDIGGTKDSARTREVYEEGLQIPPLRLYRAGALNEDLAAIVHANVRRPDMVWGDIQAQVSANQVGAQRLLAFMDEYGLDTLEPLAHEVQHRAEVAMREAIRALPDGVYHGESQIDGVEEPLTLPCTVIVRGDRLTVDWTGVPPEAPTGGVNCTYGYTAAHTTYTLKCVLTPEIPSNAGCFRPFEVIVPEGTLLNCRHPATVNWRTLTGWYIAPAILRALAPLLPDRVQAFTGLPMTCSAYGVGVDGRRYNDHIMFGGGQGGSASGDGKSSVLFPTSAANVPVEMFEQRVPILVECKELMPDSAGAGKSRGGLGQRMTVRRLDERGGAAYLAIHPHGVRVIIPGLLGGQPGGRARLAATGVPVSSPGRSTSAFVELRRTDQRILLEAAGGSGYGDPRERPLELLQRDVDEGYVTAEGLAVYGAEATRQGKVTRQSIAPGVAAEPVLPDG